MDTDVPVILETHLDKAIAALWRGTNPNRVVYAVEQRELLWALEELKRRRAAETV